MFQARDIYIQNTKLTFFSHTFFLSLSLSYMQTLSFWLSFTRTLSRTHTLFLRHILIGFRTHSETFQKQILNDWWRKLWCCVDNNMCLLKKHITDPYIPLTLFICPLIPSTLITTLYSKKVKTSK